MRIDMTCSVITAPDGRRRAGLCDQNIGVPIMKTFEVYRDGFGRVSVIDSEQDANGKRVFGTESEACEKAIADNIETIRELLALNVKLQSRLVHATAQETARICSGR
jgi:hypothetical protein